jgi:hypothetical protein
VKLLATAPPPANAHTPREGLSVSAYSYLEGPVEPFPSDGLPVRGDVNQVGATVVRGRGWGGTR